MRKTTQHLNDEHMQLYEWSGAGIGITFNIPARSKRTHPWHASYSVLAVLTSLLILNACDNKARQTEPVAVEKPQEAESLDNDQVPQPAPAEAAAPAADVAPEPAAGNVEPSGEGAQKP